MRLADCIRWIWNSAAGFRARIFLSGIIGAAGVCASMSFIWVSKLLIDTATGHRDGDIWIYGGILLACMAVQILLSIVNARLSARLSVDFRSSLRRTLFAIVMESRWTGKEVLHTGDILNRLEEDVRVVSDLVCRTVPSSVVTLLQFGMAFAILCSLDWRLAAVLVAVMPVAILLSRKYAGVMKKLTREIRDTDSREQSHLQENIQNRTLIATMQQTDMVNAGLSSIQSELREQVIRRTDYSMFSRVMIRSGFSLGYLAVFLWGAAGLQNGTVTFGMMTVFLQLVSQVQRPVVDIGRLVPAILHASASVERLSELSALQREEQGSVPPMDGKVGVRIEGISFRYPDGNVNVIEDFSYDFTPGSVTAVTGVTGSGKSTLIKLLLALLKPDRGRIVFYNGASEADSSPLTRSNLIYVPQGNTLISGTVRDNLLLGNPHASDHDIAQAVHTAVADFVYTLPEGLDTVCGERGTGLSEGQAQRISIARGLLRPGGIMLLDEPTSALDSDTERLLLERLSEVSRDKTVIIVTHRDMPEGICTGNITLFRRQP